MQERLQGGTWLIGKLKTRSLSVCSHTDILLKNGTRAAASWAGGVGAPSGASRSRYSYLHRSPVTLSKGIIFRKGFRAMSATLSGVSNIRSPLPSLFPLLWHLPFLHCPLQHTRIPASNRFSVCVLAWPLFSQTLEWISIKLLIGMQTEFELNWFGNKSQLCIH